MPESDRDDVAAATDRSTSVFVVVVGGFLTVVAVLSVGVLAIVLVNTIVDGHRAIASLSLVGILSGVGIYYLGMRELLGSGQN